MFQRLLWLFLLALIWRPALGAEHSVDLRMVVETSAAMAAADPENLRADGLDMLIQGLPDGARAGIWGFSRNVRQVAKHEDVGPLWRQVASIHAANLQSGSERIELAAALTAATWDMQQADRGVVHLVLLASGSLRLGNSAEDDARARRELLAEWAAGLKRARVTVHSLAFPGGDGDLMKQLADLSGGLHRVVTDTRSLQAAIVDIQRSAMVSPEARPEADGRFQIAPGAERFTVLWTASDDGVQAPEIVQPDGTVLSRLTPLPRGRWLRAQLFEIVTIDAPQPGWWRIVGTQPERLQVIGEIGIEVEGLDSPVVPSEDSSVAIRLYDRGELIRDRAFLDLLDIRAWAVVDGERMPLPLDVLDDGYEAFFVNLRDGAHQFEVDVIAPTFARVVTRPFVVSNPLRVEIREDQEGSIAAWLHFTHAAVDYATVRTAGLIRKPPQIATLQPGTRMPGGIWRIPLDKWEGIVEVAFSVSGNYLDGKGVFVKTKPHALQLPLADGAPVTLRYDASGAMLNLPEPEPAVVDAPLAETLPSTQSAAVDVFAEQTETVTVEPAPEVPLIPLWFVAIISLVNLLLAGFVWWMFKPARLDIAPAT